MWSGAGEIDRQLQRARVEVDGVVIEVLQVVARRLLDVSRGSPRTRASRDRAAPSRIRNRPAEVASAPTGCVGKRSTTPLNTSRARPASCRTGTRPAASASTPASTRLQRDRSDGCRAPRRARWRFVDRPERSSASATPLTLLNSIAPGSPELRHRALELPSPTPPDRSAAAWRAPRSAVRACARSAANSSLTCRASSTASSGVSTCVPGVVSVMTCVSTPCSSSTLCAVGEIAMARAPRRCSRRDSARTDCRRCRRSL